MKIERKMADRMTIEEFANAHGLTMEIVERGAFARKHTPVDRFYARFKDAEVQEGSVLIGVTGNGNSEYEAIYNYAEKIEGKMLVIDAFGSNRKEIMVPFLDGAGIALADLAKGQSK